MLIAGGTSVSFARDSDGDGPIAFTSRRDGDSEIYVMNPDGTAQTRLTSNPASDAGPAWSPDGTGIAFSSDRDGGPSLIYVMNADGTEQTAITHPRLPDTAASVGPHVIRAHATVSNHFAPGQIKHRQARL